MSDEALFQMMKNWSDMPGVSDITLDADCKYTSMFIQRVLASCAGRENGFYKIDINLWGDRLCKVPERFKNTF